MLGTIAISTFKGQQLLLGTIARDNRDNSYSDMLGTTAVSTFKGQQFFSDMLGTTAISTFKGQQFFSDMLGQQVSLYLRDILISAVLGVFWGFF